jgi:hypothetical protein
MDGGAQHIVGAVDRRRRLGIGSREVEAHAVARDGQRQAHMHRRIPHPIIVEAVGKFIDAVGKLADHPPHRPLRLIEHVLGRPDQRGRAISSRELAEPPFTNVEGRDLRHEITAQHLGLTHILQQKRQHLLVQPALSIEAKRRNAHTLGIDLARPHVIAAG